MSDLSPTDFLHNTCPQYILLIQPTIHFLFPVMSYMFQICKIAVLPLQR